MAKKKHGGGHHGGSWKVAYADFVTAMMALFMTLWLVAQDQKIKEAVERAFRSPFLSITENSAGIMPTQNKELGSSGSDRTSTATASANEVAMLRKLQSDLAQMLKKPEVEPEEESVKFQLASDGLRIHIFDRARKPVFERESSKLTPYGVWILTTLAWEISRYRTFMVELEGHTERGHEFADPEYGAWELSVERANTGRRKLIEHGVDPAQVKKVAGFADTMPLPNFLPVDPVNRRITLLLRVQMETDRRRG